MTQNMIGENMKVNSFKTEQLPEFDAWFSEKWLVSGGLITPATAAKILNKTAGRITQMMTEGKIKSYKYKNIPHTCIVKGDGKYASIAAASILAKTHRDEYMLKLAKEYPQYGWDKNMAYPTKEHREAIEKWGVTPYHRLSYRLLNQEPTLF